jgi:hypothetical protein
MRTRAGGGWRAFRVEPGQEKEVPALQKPVVRCNFGPFLSKEV